MKKAFTARRRSIQVSIETIIDNYNLRPALEQALADKDTFHLRLENGAWQPLVIEGTPEGFISVAHYAPSYVPGGRDIRDPEIVFEPNTWLGVEITMDPVGRYQRVDRPGQQYYPGIEDLAKAWGLNLRHQGFTNKSEVKATSLTHNLETLERKD